MNARRLLSERGQTLVIFVLGLFAFVALLALVLDGGNAYAAKRQAQNAADAGALAGATYMCRYKDEDGGISTAEEYAVLNGAVNPPDVFASLSAGSVVVTATVQKDTFFAGLIGFPQVSPVAIAEARCKTPMGMGVLPVAWACRDTVLGNGVIIPGADCAQKTIDDCDGDPYDLNCTYILMDSVKVKTNQKGGKCDPDETDPNDPKYCYCDPAIDDPLDPMYCADRDDLECSLHGPDVDPINLGCDYVAEGTVDCDLNNDCIDELMAGGARSWLDLDGGGGGASELSDWIRNGFPDPIPPHKWLPEESGVATSIFHTAAAAVVGEDVILPVFNNICDGVPNIPVSPESDPPAQCTYDPSIDDRSLASNSTFNFHIITFAQFHVTCVQTGKNKIIAEPGYVFSDKKGKDCNGHLEAVPESIDDNDKTIEGYFVEVNLGGYGGPGDWFDTGTFTVVLVK
jgi:hypothetical protein